MLIDHIHLKVQGGRGGKGCESYFHRKDRKKVSNGADGGNGGNVVFRASHNAPGLDRLKFKQHLEAEHGEHGGSSNQRGKNGKDLIVIVPVGTSLYRRDNNMAIRDLYVDGEEVIVARGGRGGLGNSGDRTATSGEAGEEFEINLEFRLMADVFLVGLPSSGKSSLLHRLTRAPVEGKDYPFATRSPVLGIHEYDDYKQISFCELPSIYEHSSTGHGLGTEFLKHLARARLVFFVVDGTLKFSASILSGLETLQKIVFDFDAAYKRLPMAVVLNKADTIEDLKKAGKELAKFGAPYFMVSTQTGEGMDSLMKFVYEKIEPQKNV